MLCLLSPLAEADLRLLPRVTCSDERYCSKQLYRCFGKPTSQKIRKLPCFDHEYPRMRACRGAAATTTSTWRLREGTGLYGTARVYCLLIWCDVKAMLTFQRKLFTHAWNFSDGDPDLHRPTRHVVWWQLCCFQTMYQENCVRQYMQSNVLPVCPVLRPCGVACHCKSHDLGATRLIWDMA